MPADRPGARSASVLIAGCLGPGTRSQAAGSAEGVGGVAVAARVAVAAGASLLRHPTSAAQRVGAGRASGLPTQRACCNAPTALHGRVGGGGCLGPAARLADTTTGEVATPLLRCCGPPHPKSTRQSGRPAVGSDPPSATDLWEWRPGESALRPGPGGGRRRVASRWARVGVVAPSRGAAPRDSATQPELEREPRTTRAWHDSAGT